MAIVDAGSGQVYYPPISFGGIGQKSFDLPLLADGEAVPKNPEVEFELGSRLMVVRAALRSERPGPSRPYTFYFLWENGRWALLAKVPFLLPKR
jgi:hypothetical protein